MNTEAEKITKRQSEVLSITSANFQFEYLMEVLMRYMTKDQGIHIWATDLEPRVEAVRKWFKWANMLSTMRITQVVEDESPSSEGKSVLSIKGLTHLGRPVELIIHGVTPSDVEFKEAVHP